MGFKKGIKYPWQFSKGQPPWNYGKKGCYTPEMLKHRSECQKGNKSPQYKIPRSPEIRKKISEENSGANHWNWKEGKSRKYNTRIYKEITKNLEHRCCLCGGIYNLLIHHVDKNIKNNDILNLKIMCHPCHIKLHKPRNKKKVERMMKCN